MTRPQRILVNWLRSNEHAHARSEAFAEDVANGAPHSIRRPVVQLHHADRRAVGADALNATNRRPVRHLEKSDQRRLDG